MYTMKKVYPIGLSLWTCSIVPLAWRQVPDLGMDARIARTHLPISPCGEIGKCVHCELILEIRAPDWHDRNATPIDRRLHTKLFVEDRTNPALTRNT